MNDDELWAAIDVQRLRTVDVLEALTPREWERPSLCAGWTVRDVAAHLTLQQLTLGSALRGALRHPGSVNHVINATARDRASLPTDRIVAEIRGTVGSRRHNVGLTPHETLIDIVVHGQDIAVPTGHPLEVPPEVAATAASRVWADRGTRKAKVFTALPSDGLRLAATDTDWSVGEGPEVRGPVLALLLLLTGRTVVLPQLEGEGAAALGERLAAARH
ncbi:maleylpyruvate isomerase family mycothiol-dependent enzyme [Nocardioides sediminis]|uniref:maleylpyruvate isomerase family mycothiol-dependent enzyme n=1 Tax=Nocardioides sediminis TaxID=433648 RepID=UPI000D30AE11|nr:maleylpyruvate isomerase family mycothiol-dependent enzyme [Nocardioides sediminis]